MRSEADMYALILATARTDERVRAVILNGSRANPNAPRDRFQDFDVVYVVTELESFKANPGWIDCFGERMILQLPDDMEDPAPEGRGSYAYLIQLADGNRIDLTLMPLEVFAGLPRDSLSILLLDKDERFEPFPPPSESDYLPQQPAPKLFADCCNEFWWVCPYAAKGLWRDEILYALHILEIGREQLMKMLVWRIGYETGFQVNPGKMGKYFRRYLTPEDWNRLLATYPTAEEERVWQALETMTGLFRDAAQWVTARAGFEYPQEDDARVSAHLQRVRDMARD